MTQFTVANQVNKTNLFTLRNQKVYAYSIEICFYICRTKKVFNPQVFPDISGTRGEKCLYFINTCHHEFQVEARKRSEMSPFL